MRSQKTRHEGGMISFLVLQRPSDQHIVKPFPLPLKTSFLLVGDVKKQEKKKKNGAAVVVSFAKGRERKKKDEEKQKQKHQIRWPKRKTESHLFQKDQNAWKNALKIYLFCMSLERSLVVKTNATFLV